MNLFPEQRGIIQWSYMTISILQINVGKYHKLQLSKHLTLKKNEKNEKQKAVMQFQTRDI